MIATGRSDRHVRAIADAVVEGAKQRGREPLGIEGYEDGALDPDRLRAT